VAERAATLGVPPDGRPETVATTAAPQGPKEGWVQDTEVVGVLVEALETTIGLLRERITATAEPDPVTQDLLIGLTAELEKHRWMFQAEDWPRRA
jgi:starvation-inducible DNA-binding protein